MVTGAVGIMSAFFIAALLYFASDQIMKIFTDDQAVITLGNTLVIILATIQIPKSANIVYSGNLRGSADLNWLMWLAIITAFGYEIVGSWILAIPCGLGVSGIWIIQGVDETTRLCLNFWRFNRAKWKKIDL